MTDSSASPDETPSDDSVEAQSEQARDFARVQELFWQAVALPAEERIAWVQQQRLPSHFARQVIAAVEVDLADNADTQESDGHNKALAETIQYGVEQHPVTDCQPFFVRPASCRRFQTTKSLKRSIAAEWASSTEHASFALTVLSPSK